MSLLRAIRLAAPAAALGMLFPACDSGTGAQGDGALAAAGTVVYGDTAYAVVAYNGARNVLMSPLDTLRSGPGYFSDRIGYTVTGTSFTFRRGDSTVLNVGSALTVGVGAAVPVSGTFEVYDYSGPRAGLTGKARLDVYGLGPEPAWSRADSSAGGKVRVIVTADSVQVLGNDIKLSRGVRISFNLKSARIF
jgi:hypothetical protein